MVVSFQVPARLIALDLTDFLVWNGVFASTARGFWVNRRCVGKSLMKMKLFSRIKDSVLCQIVLLTMLGIAQQPPHTSAASPGDSVIGGGDLIDIATVDVPELTLKVRVGDSGKIDLPLIGPVVATGRTVSQLQEDLRDLLVSKNLVLHPQVSVLVEEFGSLSISVLGEVAKPSTIPLIGKRRLFDAISAAGGLTPTASDKATLLRKGEPEQIIDLPLGSTADKDLDPSNILLQPGDTIVVRRAGVVYVVGDVMRPGGFVMSSDQMSVLQALALAEGNKPYAKLDSASILRRNGPTLTQVPVQLNAIMKGKAPDIMMTPEDVLYIPSSTARMAAATSGKSLMQMISGIVIYSRPF